MGTDILTGMDNATGLDTSTSRANLGLLYSREIADDELVREGGKGNSYTMLLNNEGREGTT